MTCDECHLWRRCPCYGVSPTETEKGNVVECVVEADGPDGELVAVPKQLLVNADSGKVTGVVVERILFRRSWWRRLRKMP